MIVASPDRQSQGFSLFARSALGTDGSANVAANSSLSCFVLDFNDRVGDVHQMIERCEQHRVSKISRGDQFRWIWQCAVLLIVIGGIGYFAWRTSVLRASGRTLRTAGLLLLKGDAVAARESVNGLLWFEPRNPDALRFAVMSELKQNNLSAAKELVDRIPVESSVHENTQALLAGALLADRQFDRAEELFVQHLSRYPKSLVACRHFSELLLTELRYREALQIQEACLRSLSLSPILLPDRLSILRELARSEFHPPAKDGCVSELDRALKRHPHQAHVELSLGRCYLHLGDLDAAAQFLMEGTLRESCSVELQLLRGELWLAREDLDQAEAALLAFPNKTSRPTEDDRAVLEKEDRVWDLQCRIAEARGELDRALSHITRALAIRPASRDYEARRARLLQKSQQFEEAQQAYSRSHQLARAELALWRMSRDIGQRIPDAAECDQVAQDYETLGRQLVADAWRELGRQIATEALTK